MLLWVAMPLALARLPGCVASRPTTQPVTVQQRQDAALKDPFGYKPPFGDMTGDNSQFDKDGMERDLNDVLNP